MQIWWDYRINVLIPIIMVDLFENGELNGLELHHKNEDYYDKITKIKRPYLPYY